MRLAGIRQIPFIFWCLWKFLYSESVIRGCSFYLWSYSTVFLFFLSRTKPPSHHSSLPAPSALSVAPVPLQVATWRPKFTSSSAWPPSPAKTSDQIGRAAAAYYYKKAPFRKWGGRGGTPTPTHQSPSQNTSHDTDPEQSSPYTPAPCPICGSSATGMSRSCLF